MSRELNPADADAAVAIGVQRELQRYLDQAAEAVHWVGPEGIILWANRTELALLGYSPNDYIGHHINEFHVDASIVEELLRRLAQSETVQNYEARVRHKNGSIRVVHINSSALWRDGQFVHTQCFTRDVTEMKAADLVARRLEARDRFLIDLDDLLRPLIDPEDITFRAAKALGEHLDADRCAYATVEADEDTFLLTGNYTRGVHSIIGRYTFRQFGEECLRLMRTGEPYVVRDSDTDPRITADERPSYQATAIRAVICVPILKQRRFVAAMAVHCVVPTEWHADEVELVQRVASRCWESIERARVTHSLAESEQQFRQLANSIANLAWMARPDGWIYWYNDQWYGYTGTVPEEMEGWGWERVHHPEWLQKVKEKWQASIASGTAFEMVFPIRGADGEFRRFLTRVNPVRDFAGQVRHWFGTNTDVENERLAAETNASLREGERLARKEAELQKQLLHSLFMQAPMFIAVLRGPDHVVELANPPVCKVWGYPAEKILNRPLLDVLPELRTQVFESLLANVYATGEPHFGTEVPATFDRGDTVFFNFAYVPFRGVDGRVEGIFVIASDVTEQVTARNQVNGLREAAESANRAKDEFLAMLGHELRNPLSPILTALHLMKLRGDERSEHERTIIQRQVSHLARLVDDLLDVSRIARGNIELQREPIEISEIVARAIEVAAPLLEQRTHDLVLDVPRQGLSVDGDATRLSQVLSNLLTNAAKYTQPGGQISLTAWQDNGHVCIAVKDTGIGIAPQFLPTVFDLFVQERQGIDRPQGGLGLGLTIVRNLVESHAGTVSAHSEGVGKGSTFEVRLPRAIDGAVAALRVAPMSNETLSSSKKSVSFKILVVDDNEDGAEVLARALSASGHQVKIANDAPTALNIAAEFKPAIAVLDIGLPVMDGYELAARLRQLPGLRGVRLIALTGYGQDTDRQRALAAGFDHHLVKPVDFQKVQALISAAIGV